MGRYLDTDTLFKAIAVGLLTYLVIFNTLSYYEFKGDTHYLVINRQASAEEAENEPCDDVESHSSVASLEERAYEVDYETYDVPLDEDLQVYVIAMARAYGIEPNLVFAIIRKESSYSVDAVSKGGGNVGLMQINHTNFGWLSKDLNVCDFQDPYNNIQAGCYILSILFERYGDTDKVLMAYNQGEGSAQAFWQQGIFTSHYTKTIHRYMEELESEATKEID